MHRANALLLATSRSAYRMEAGASTPTAWSPEPQLIQRWIITPPEEMTCKLAVYKNLTNGMIALRRAALQKVRLEIERELLELLRNRWRRKTSDCGQAAAPEEGRTMPLPEIHSDYFDRFDPL